jgi:hypothetical protein
MSKAKKHAPVEHRSHHAAKVEAEAVIVAEVAEDMADAAVGEVLPGVVELPSVEITDTPGVVGSLKNFGQEVAKIVETLPPNLPPAETTIADHFDCACGPKRNLSMEAGVYRCHGCGTTHHAQTLEGRKAASK